MKRRSMLLGSALAGAGVVLGESPSVIEAAEPSLYVFLHSLLEARALAQREPSVFRLVSDREPIGWISVLLADVDESEFADLLHEAWSLRAAEPAPRRRRSG